MCDRVRSFYPLKQKWGRGVRTPGPVTQEVLAPMHDESKQNRSTVDERAQRAIILQLLRDDHAPVWRRAELERELGNAAAFTDALAGLACTEVVRLDREGIYATCCARHLDKLGLIGV
jgi:hypothetical protein